MPLGAGLICDTRRTIMRHMSHEAVADKRRRRLAKTSVWPARSLLTAAVAIGALAMVHPSAAPRPADVEPLMARFLADSRVVGVSVGVERGSEVIVRGGWGLA